jgi:uncharacterized protein YndB with AHSA1/START domain
MISPALAHRLDRTLVIRARREIVFEFFSDTPQWASWWGSGSSIDPQPGGRMVIRHPNGVEASGEVLEVRAPERIVFTYGYADRKPSPPGSSRVTIRLDSHPRGTLLQLTHEFADGDAHEEHVQGWRFQLSLFANLIADNANRGASGIVDQWFAAWGEPDEATRDGSLAAITTPEIQVQDRFTSIDGVDDLKIHLAAAQRFMPGTRLERRGAIRHCQWHVLADWVAIGHVGNERGRGTNLFVLNVDGRITAVTGFWTAPNV